MPLILRCTPRIVREKVKGLSTRESEVFAGLAVGASLNKIAASWNLTPSSISEYRRRILEKLKLRNDAELVIYAHRAACLEVEEVKFD